ncbi:MAG: hypothetical protein IAG13_29435 [Deltaproteobacteria bacterium]|nr:hypothetical protein [Nannocystaceae bacterium]
MAQLEREHGLLARMRASATRSRIAIALALVVAMPLIVLLLAPRPDIGVYPRARLVLEVLLYAVPALLATALALWPLHRAEPSVARAIISGAAVLAAITVASLPPAHADHPASLAGGGDDFVARALGCMMYGIVCAIPAFILLRLLAREGARVGAKAWVLAFAAASCGAAAVFLHCPIVHVGHRWAGHVAVLVVAAVWAALHLHGRARAARPIDR